MCVTSPKSVCSRMRGFDEKSLIWLRTCAKLCPLQDPSMGRAQAVALKIGLQHVVRLKKRAPTTRKGTWLAALKDSWMIMFANMVSIGPLFISVQGVCGAQPDAEEVHSEQACSGRRRFHRDDQTSRLNSFAVCRRPR